MKPDLINKNLVYDMIYKKNKVSEKISLDNKSVYFNFLLILFFIFCFTILFFKFLEKRDNKKNIS